MTIAVELVALILCVAACVKSVNDMEVCQETRMGHFGMALIWGAAAVLVSYWLGVAVTDWFLERFQQTG